MMRILACEEIREELVSRGLPRATIWGRGVDVRHFHPDRRARWWRETIQADDDATVILHVGRLAPEKNLDILIDGRQQVHQAFDGEAGQLVVAKRGYLRLRQSQHLGGIGLGELAVIQHPIQGIGQAQLGLPLGSVWEPQVGEHVSAAVRDSHALIIPVLGCSRNSRLASAKL